MTAKELREAATIAKISDGPLMNVMADYILANVQEDGDEQPTPSWIEENFPVSESSHGFYGIGGLHFTFSGASWHCCKNRTPQSVICSITTRSQFRSLMAGLGIEPEKKYLKKI